MRNYVIINGVNSSTKTGLAIKELPPISKPLMRATREEIDGRDGDIVTKLGYSAYDKTMEIGLFGTYDIDSIISYFTGSGTITFSNESDKYYRYEILNQIDYNQLIKFRTASVVLHCQPFKYEVGETAITLSSGNTTVKNKGNIFSKPILYIKGSGTITVSLNSTQILSIDLTDNDEIIIDTEKLEAYDPDTSELLNRYVVGDYDDLTLPTGNNTITLGGTITTANITMYSRWL